MSYRPTGWYAQEAVMCFLLPIVAVAILLWCGVVLLRVIVRDLLWQRSVRVGVFARFEQHSPLLPGKCVAPKIIPLRFLA